MRTTSVQAYEQVKACGLVTGLRLKVYSALYEQGPLTAHEVAQLPDLRTHQLDSVRPRFAELEDLGVVISVGERECTVTHMKALVWDVTDHIPTKTDLKSSKVEKAVGFICRKKFVGLYLPEHSPHTEAWKRWFAAKLKITEAELDQETVLRRVVKRELGDPTG